MALQVRHPALVVHRDIEQTAEYPTGPVTTLELQNPSHDASELYKMCISPDFEALKKL